MTTPDKLRIEAEHEVFSILEIGDVLNADQIADIRRHATKTNTRPGVVLREIINAWRGEG